MREIPGPAGNSISGGMTQANPEINGGGGGGFTGMPRSFTQKIVSKVTKDAKILNSNYFQKCRPWKEMLKLLQSDAFVSSSGHLKNPASPSEKALKSAAQAPPQSNLTSSAAARKQSVTFSEPSSSSPENNFSEKMVNDISYSVKDEGIANTDPKKNRLSRLIMIVKEYKKQHDGGMIVLLDPSGEIKGTVHKSLAKFLGSSLVNGVCLYLRDVSVFKPTPSSRHLILSLDNFYALTAIDGSVLVNTAKFDRDIDSVVVKGSCSSDEDEDCTEQELPNHSASPKVHTTSKVKSKRLTLADVQNYQQPEQVVSFAVNHNTTRPAKEHAPSSPIAAPGSKENHLNGLSDTFSFDDDLIPPPTSNLIPSVSRNGTIPLSQVSFTGVAANIIEKTPLTGLESHPTPIAFPSFVGNSAAFFEEALDEDDFEDF